MRIGDDRARTDDRDGPWGRWPWPGLRQGVGFDGLRRRHPAPRRSSRAVCHRRTSSSAATLQVLRNSINLLGLGSQLEFAVIGAVLLAGVAADELVRRWHTARLERRGAG